jgi:uncharacterized protein YdhG (YjbR/CyaY superfamily)
MATRKTALKGTPKSAKRTDAGSKGFTAAEKAAMRDRVKELKATASKEEEERAVVEKLASMPAPDREIGERLHKIIKTNAPALSARLWYGMPAYAKDGKIVCHFQDANKFKLRYATIGFSDEANLDEGTMWPVVFALKKLTATEEARIVALVKKAVS